MDRLENIPPKHLPIVLGSLLRHQELVNERLRKQLDLLKNPQEVSARAVHVKEKARVVFALAAAKHLESRPGHAFEDFPDQEGEVEEYIRLFTLSRADRSPAELQLEVADLRAHLDGS